MKLSQTIAILLATSSFAFGQFGDQLRSGRPGFSIGPYTVGAMVFQSQVGLIQAGINRVGPPKAERNTTTGIGIFSIWID